MALDLTELTAEVTRDNDVNTSAATLITLLADKLEEAATDPVAIAALVASLRAQSDTLAAAVVANTPAAV